MPVNQAVAAGASLTYTLPAAMDPEGNTCTYSVLSYTPAVTFITVTGISLTIAPLVTNYPQAAINVSFSISDGAYSTEYFFLVNINAPVGA
jgi:hypothetical protein